MSQHLQSDLAQYLWSTKYRQKPCEHSQHYQGRTRLLQPFHSLSIVNQLIDAKEEKQQESGTIVAEYTQSLSQLS